MKGLLSTLIIALICTLAPPQTHAGINNSYEDKALKISFPKTLGVYKRSDLTRYDDNLGYSVAYKHKHSIVTIYVYTQGYSQIGNGVDDPNTIETFKAAKKDITALKAAGLYKEMEVTRTGVTELSKTSTHPFLILDLQITLPGRNGKADLNVHSKLLVSGFRNHFLKIRATQPSAADEEALDDMLSAFAAFLKVHI